ncbi:uncharacterized protein LOC135701138 [Ochlerotatus camptorhynchus]|uniref:uncharacterized protein LOC135701138 n=1 Tax=Ochlerotatus camptorhynchus TaxID=644619 RepID=UPI0031D74AF1
MGEEHEHYGVLPLLDKAFNETFGYGSVTDDLRSNVKNVIQDEANSKLSSHEQELLGIRRTVPGWDGEPPRRVFDNGNKDQNNNETDENDDYEYKIANQSGLLSSSPSSDSGDSAEINDRVVVLGQRFNGESMQDKDVPEKKSTLGWLKRKLLSIEGDSVADDRDDTESDYNDDKRWRVGLAGEFKRRGGSYRNDGDDDRDKLGDPTGDDYYHKSDDPQGDISDLALSANRYPADMGDIHTSWDKANHKRKIIEEMNGRVDSRNYDKVTSFRRRKSAKPVGEGGGEMSPGGTSDKKEETIQDQSTVYRQQDDDSDQVETTTACDCAAKCATAESTTDESTQETDATEASGVDEEVTTEEPEEEEDEEEITSEEPVEQPESSAESDSGQKKEVYIDLRIGIKNVGNDSTASQEEPVEFHKKIVVKREELENNVSAQAESSESNFPIDLVKAIYQLVDKDDSLRKHVAPRLPDRTKLLSKLEQPGRRQKINDHRLESTGVDKSRAGGGPSMGAAPSVASIEDNKTNSKALASVLEAIGELIRRRS